MYNTTMLGLVGHFSSPFFIEFKTLHVNDLCTFPSYLFKKNKI